MMYAHVNCFVVRGCAVSRRYVYNCDDFVLLMCTMTIRSSVLCLFVAVDFINEIK